MTADFETCPAIWAVLYRHSPPRKYGRRLIINDKPSSVDLEEIKNVARELQLPEVMAQLDAAEVATLAAAAAEAQKRYGDDAGAASALQAILSSRRGELDADIALVAISGYGLHRDILKVFPEMAKSAAMIEAIIEAASQGSLAGWHRNVNVNAVVIRDLNQARRAFPAVEGLTADLVLTVLIAAMARGLGWTPWVKLFAILCDEVELADETKTAVPEKREWDSWEAI